MEYQHINLDFLDRFAKGDANRVSKYINMFLTAAPEHIKMMRDNYAAKDWEQLKAAAHSLKPQVGYMGMDSLKEVIPRIEEYAREKKNLDEVPALIEKVEGICESAYTELRQALEQLNA